MLFVGGFLMVGSSSVIRGLVINNFAGQGIAVGFGSTANTVEGNYIGTNSAGTAGAPNGGDGVDWAVPRRLGRRPARAERRR